MKRLVSTMFCGLISFTAFAADSDGTSKAAIEFAKHFQNAKELTLAVADAMPAENYDFRPNPEEMSFGEQVRHIAGVNYDYCSFIKGGRSPFVRPEKVDKETVMKLVGLSFDYCIEAVSPLTDAQFNATKGPLSTREAALGAMMHMAHHRGQIEVYLRLQNIKPPAYKF